MLSIKRLLELAEQMDVEVTNNDSGQHYIVGENGEKRIFTTKEMIGSLDHEFETVKVNENAHVPCAGNVNISKPSANYIYTSKLKSLKTEYELIA